MFQPEIRREIEAGLKLAKCYIQHSLSFAEALFLAQTVIHEMVSTYPFTQYMCIYVCTYTKDYMESVTFYNCTMRPRFGIVL